MKKNLLCVLAASLLGAMPLSARVLDASEALSAVQGAMQSRAMRAPSALRSGLRLAKTVSTAAGTPALYLFTPASGGGAVIASAESMTPSLLGYFPEGTFNGSALNPGLKYWLSTYAAQIEYVRRHPAAAFPQAPAKAESLGAAVEPLCQTKWDQASPYCDLCPTLNGAATATGCVATAMAQAMKVFDYPEKGTGTVAYTWKSTGDELTLDLSADTYDWANMLPVYGGGSATAEQDAAVALLMRDAGYAVQMNYGDINASGSSAVDSKIPSALIDNFGYDVAIYKASRDNYDLQAWNQLIYDELAKGHPVVYNGVTSKMEGHSFVCDGYDGEGHYHINWGWSGADNGYFLLSALNPAAMGIGGGSTGYGFNYSQSAIIGIQKPQPGSTPHMQMTCNDDFCIDDPACGALDDVFQFSGAFLNSSAVSVSGNAGVKITNEAGETVYVAGSRLNSFPANYFFTEYQVSGEEMPRAVGTYTVQPAFYANSDQAWHDMLANPEVRNTLTMTVTETRRSFASEENSGFVGTVYATDLTVTPSTLSVGEEFTAKATLRNESETDFTGSIYGVLIQEAQGTYYGKGQAPEMSVSIPAGSAQEITYTAAFSNAERGTFDFYLSIGNDLICNPVKVTIVPGEDQPNTDADLYALSLNLSTRNLRNDVPFTVNATLYNLGSGTFSGPIHGALAQVQDGKTVIVARGPEKDVTVAGDYSSLDITYQCQFSGVKAGNYDFYIMEGSNDISNPVPVSISDDAQSGTSLSLTDFSIISGRDGADGVREVPKEKICVSVSVMCEATAFKGDVDVVVTDQQGNYLGDLCGQEFDLKEGQNGIMIGQGDFLEAEEGATYLMAVFHGNDQIGTTILPFRINSDASGLTGPEETSAKLRLQDGVLELIGAPVGCSLTLYTADGQCLRSAAVSAVDISDLPKGVYIAVADTPQGRQYLRFVQ